MNRYQNEDKSAYLAKGILIAVFLFVFSVLSEAAGGWLDPAWQSRSVVAVSNPGGTVLTGFQVHVALDSSFDFTKAKIDGSDLRFTLDDGVTLIPFWIEAWNPVDKTASLWVRGPTVQQAGATLYLYYGNPAAVSASDGNATFEFFDDFSSDLSGSQLSGYYSLGDPQTVLAQDQPWEDTAPHTLSVVQVNSSGYAYWGYYGLQAECGGVGLAFSKDLANWTKYSGNPLFLNGRWPSVLKVGNTFYMLYTKDYCYTSYIKLAASVDGINFTDVKTIVQPRNRDQNPHLYYNPNDGKYYIYWYSGVGYPFWTLRARSATTIEGLDDTSSETIILQSEKVLAAPNMLFHDGAYFLSTESEDINGFWRTQVYSSKSPTSGFYLLPGNPVMDSGSACSFQHLFGTILHNYYCKLTGNTWTVEHRAADLTAGRLQFPGQSFDATKWRATGGSWQVTAAAQQDGFLGGIVKGSIGSSMRQVLLSSYQGSDYVLETYGNQRSGRVWGLGVRSASEDVLYSINLYEDLDGTDNLHVYNWVGGGATALKSAPVGRIDANTWHKLSVKVHANAIDVYKDNVLVLQTSASQYGFGAVALYGEWDTVADFNNVLVRKYAAIEPSAALLTLASVSLNPITVMGGSTSQGTVVLNGPAPSGGAIVTLSSSDPSVASVPAAVMVPGGNTSANFPVITNPVSVSHVLKISASYGGGAKTAILTVTLPAIGVASVSSGSIDSGSSLTLSHTTSGSDRLMLVGVSLIPEGKDNSVSSITYNDIALTKAGSIVKGDKAKVEIWRLIAPPTGTSNAVIAFNSSVTSGAVAGVMTFTGVNQTAPLGTFVSANGRSSDASVNVSSAVGEMIFGVVDARTSSSLTPGSAQTEQWALSADSRNSQGAGSTQPGATTVTTSWRLGSSDDWAIAAVPIKPASVTATYTITATAGTGGSITPSGSVTVTSSGSQTFTIAANTGYSIADVKVDGISVGTVSAYPFNNVTANHTLAVTFVAAAYPKFTLIHPSLISGMLR